MMRSLSEVVSSTYSMLLIALMLGSIAVAMVPAEEVPPAALLSEHEPQFASSATSPGHVVFGQYISGDNCGHCSKVGGGSDTHHMLKQNFPDEYVYVTYMAQHFGDTDTARAGKVGPYNWPWSTSGAPDAYFGDRTDRRQSGASSNYDSYDSQFSSGGGMHSTTNDYRMSASISPNGNTFDISIGYRYVGTGTPATNMKLYAAIVEEECTTYTYSSSGIPHGYHCWMGWLTSGDTYKTRNMGTGSAFHSVSVTSTEQTETWSTVPTSLIQGGTQNAMVVAVLMAGNSVSLGGSTPHVYHAVDSSMGPLIDLGVSDFSVVNDGGHDGYVPGDTLSLTATVRNYGDDAYEDGGRLEFYRVNPDGTSTRIEAPSVLNRFSQTGVTQTLTTTVDTTGGSESVYGTAYRAVLSDLTMDRNPSNNVASVMVVQDKAPRANAPILQGSPEVNRVEAFVVEVSGTSQDGVDELSDHTAEIEISPSDAGQWSDAIVTLARGFQGAGTTNERFEFVLRADDSMGAGSYDVRGRLIDARGLVSEWTVREDAFSLVNALPRITSTTIPTVDVNEATRIDVGALGLISDPETPLNELVVTSDSPNFLGWYPASGEIEVMFDRVPVGSDGVARSGLIFVEVFDGDRTGSGTLVFNVDQNGQPRWLPLPAVSLMEDGQTSFNLLNYLRDTDIDGNEVSASNLAVQVRNISDETLVRATIRDGHFLDIETVDDDVNGMLELTLRASDELQVSDTVMTVIVQNVNDAPRFDFGAHSHLSLRPGEQTAFDLRSMVSDVDGATQDIWLEVSATPPQAAQFNPATGTLVVAFDEEGTHEVTVTATDRFSAVTTERFSVTVSSIEPLAVTTDATLASDVLVRVEGAHVTGHPHAHVDLRTTELSDVRSEWQICSLESGICFDFMVIDHDTTAPSEAGHALSFQRAAYGLIELDQVKLSRLTAVDASGTTRTATETLYWNITEFAPPSTELSDVELEARIVDLTDRLERIEVDLGVDDLNADDRAALESIQSDVSALLDADCEDARSDCDATSGETTVAESGLLSGGLSGSVLGMGAAILGVLVVGLVLAAVLRREDNDGYDIMPVAMQGVMPGALPAHDPVANSMYGGAGHLFTTPVAYYGPPVPASGLPPGWSMEQWQYYGHIYLAQQANTTGTGPN